MAKLNSYDRLLLVLSAMVAVTLTVLSALGETRIDVYFSMYVLEYFVATALHSPLPKPIERRLRWVSVALLAGFIIVVAYRVTLIIAPSLLASLLGQPQV